MRTDKNIEHNLLVYCKKNKLQKINLFLKFINTN